VEKLEEELSGTFRKGGVDFSYLDTSLQLRVLTAAAHEPGFRSEMRTLNPEIARRLSTILSERPSARIQAVDKRFGPVAYADRVDRVLSSFDTEAAGHLDADPVLVQSRVRSAFARAEHVRLLYD
jgi:hypothetical protein